MPARVQVIVDAKDSASGVLRGIANQFGQLGNVVQELTGMSINWGNLSTQAAQFVGDQLRDSIKVTQAYAEEVRNLSQVSGTSAEESSRLIQVLDDWEVSTNDVMTATRYLTNNGLTPNLETIAQLSDQYLKINNEQERNKFILDNLGRSGLQWVNVLKQGGAALREQGESIDDNMILTDESIRQTEEYRLALDSWNDAVMGVKIAIGMQLIPTLTELISVEARAAAQEERWNKARIEGGNMSRASAGIEMQHAQAVEEASAAADSATRSYTAYAQAVSNGSEIIQQAETDYKSLVSSIMSAQDHIDDYREKNDEIMSSEADLMNQRAQLVAQLELLKTRGYRDTSKAVQEVKDDIEELDGKLGDNKKKLAENEAAHRKWAAQTVFSFAQARAAADGSITQGEGEALIKIGQSLDLFDQQTADVMRSVNESFDNLDTRQGIKAIDEMYRKLLLLKNTNWTVTVPVNIGTTCFLAGTLITMADRSQKPIEQMEIGDMVSSYDFYSGKVIKTYVSYVYRHAPEEMGNYYIIVNDKTKVTPNHMMFINGVWMPASSLKIGDELYSSDLSPVLVTSVARVGERVPTFNLHIENENHNYFADGVLVHNAKIGDERQVGGTTYAGNMYWTGEAGREPFIPSQNGRILGNAESINALQRGGGSVGPFYGPVTLEISEGNNGGLLSLR